MTQRAKATWAYWLTHTTLLVVGVAATSHGREYYGGTLHWEAEDSTPTAEGFVRIRIVSSLALHSTTKCSLNETWSCPAGSAELQVQGRYRCAGASERDGWKMLMSSFTMLTNGGTAEHRSCCWHNASLMSATETKPPLDTYGYLLASSIDPRTRSDTNQSNNSPKAAFPPLIRVNGACESEQRVVASDADGDRVRCRYARGPECPDGCGSFPNAQLLEDLCVFRFGGPTRGRPLAGTYGVTVVVEDSPASTIHLDESAKGPYDVLSSVPLHFTVVVSYSGYPCTSKPAFVGLTPLQGASLCTQVGRTLKVPINVVTFQTPPTSASITHLVVYGRDILAGSVVRNYKDPSLFQTYLKWKIASKDVGKHLICFFAVDSEGQQSDLRCITVVVSDSYLPSKRMLKKTSPLAPVQMSISSNATYADMVTFIVTFNDLVVSTLDARAHVRFYEVESGRLAHCVNASDCSRVRMDPHNEREFSVSTPPFTFRGATRYCMKLDGAVVQGAGGAGEDTGAARVDSEPHEECTWIFFFQRRVFASGCGDGDPHYKSFDGLRFDYMGTKPFLLAGTCNKTADEWAVYAKNERWGTQTVSWTKKAWIFVYGFQVVLDSSGAWVNDVAVNMPYKDPLYRFHIFKSQNDHVLRTNLEFSVKFGDSRVVVELENPIRYGNMTCGLLGDYDGNVTNEWTAPGFRATTGAQFGNYWIVDFLGESGLPDDGSSSRFIQQRAGTLLGSADTCRELESGPLAECSATVAMGPYHTACVYDLSVEHLMDMHVGLCRALQAYVDDCYAAGGRVNATWRNVTGCMHSCPPTSVYSTVASACPASCGDGNAELGCGDPPREGCVCPAGRIWDKDSCVLPSECGCTRNGKYYSVGDLYMDGNCSVQCTCRGLDVASCQPYTHNATTSYCGVDVDGVHGSHPKWATCYVGGSIRFKTFDGYPYTYQGTQSLVLAKPCGSQSGEAWSVLVKSKPLLPLWTGSELLEVHVSVYGLTLKLFRSGSLLVDGMATGVPFMYPSRDSPLLVVANSGSFLILDTAVALGLQVHLDLGAGYAYVRVLTSYWGRVCGLCGNMNGDPVDDLRLPTGAVARDAASFGDAWAAAVDWNDGFKQGAPRAAEVVVAARLLNDSCARLLGDAVLRRCHGVVDVVPHYDNCVADRPLEPAAPAACLALAAYAAVCALAGVPLWDWRASTLCLAPACPQNSHHEACAVSCPPTCTDLQAEKNCVVKAPCLEGCSCDFGFVWSGGRCVLPEQCGCIDGARYYEVGSTFRNANCTSLCKCTPSRSVVCSPFPCEGFCVLKDENRYCVPKKKQCHTVGDPHYSTFDGMTFDVHHACNYTLLTLLSKPSCSVVARLEQKPYSATASTVALYITEGADTITLGRGSAVYVDGIRRNLPVATASFVALESAGHVLLFSVAEPYLVRYDGWGTAMIEVLSLNNRTGGLCGNNNGREDDFGDVVEFANSWAAPSNNSNCDLRDSAALGATPLQWAAPAASSGACWVLSNPTGPFAACHAVRSPAWWFQSCVADAALPGRHEPTSACALLHDYHALCREVSVYVGEWRAAARCELACPPHSHYTLCARMCPPSCATADEEVVCDWPCVEGCQCHVGYFKHDGECVAQEDCGCVEEGSGGGFFYHPINAEFYNSNCSLLYTCQRNRTLTSAPTACAASQCRLSDGAYRCEQDGRMEVECHDEHMVARIPKDVLLGLGASSLRLRTQAEGCALRDDGKFVVFNVSLAACGTDFEEKESDFVFTQTVTLVTADSSMVVTYDYISILVNAICKIPRFKLLSQGVFKANWSKMSLEQIAYASLDLKMDFYTDAQFTEAFSPSQYPLSLSLGQYLYLQVSIKSGLDLVLFTIDCYATPTSSSQDSVKHYLISEGCLNADVHNHTASRTKRRFSFKAFSFAMANAHHFYVHCYMLVCKTTELDSRCWRGCAQQPRRRSSSSRSISSVSSPVYLLTRGPLVRWRDETPALEGMAHFSTPVLMAVSACVTALLMLAVCVIKLNSARIFFLCMRK
ncbi:alpha-tectorin-like [Petromyzon marinus]|uniref:alpha-tectorin-like n=1 Tax=Petromyzon marinus TaxID=7757 RepID=UPI003F713C25